MSTERTYKQSIPAGPLAFWGILFLIFITGFSVLVYMVFSARADADAASLTLSGKLQDEMLLQNSAQTANQTKAERIALQALPVQKNGGATFIASVESLGKVAKTDASVFSVSAIAGVGGAPGKLTMSVKFSGTFEACMRFVQMIETMPQGVALSGLSLQDDPVSHMWSGTLMLSALSYDIP